MKAHSPDASHSSLITPRRLAAWTLLVTALVGCAAAFGVFARGDGASVLVTSARGETYEMATSGVYANNALALVAEGVGWDVFTLLVVVPAFVARSSFRAVLVAAGLFGYVTYLHLEYAVTWAFGPMFPLFAVTLGASLVGIVAAAILLAGFGIRERFDARFPRRSWAGVSLGMSILLVVLWSARIVEGLTASVPTLHGETTMTVQALDLGLVVPMAVVIAVAALHRHPAGLAAAAAFSVTFVTMSAAIAAMMVSSWIVTGVSALPPIVVFSLAAITGLWTAARMYASADPIARPEPVEGAAGLRPASPRAG
jgi:hypothetical protein